jgi:hypothetical protein
MRTQETRNKRVHLEELCPFAGGCDESDYCSHNYKTCKKVEKVPPGICWGAIEPWPEKYLHWKLLGLGRVHKDEKERNNRLFK